MMVMSFIFMHVNLIYLILDFTVIIIVLMVNCFRDDFLTNDYGQCHPAHIHGNRPYALQILHKIEYIYLENVL